MEAGIYPSAKANTAMDTENTAMDTESTAMDTESTAMDTEEGCRKLDLIDAMVVSADGSVNDEESRKIELNACPGCGCCSGMFTANSMNCLTEAIGMALPGNGTIVATHKRRIDLFKKAAQLIVRNAHEYYENGNELAEEHLHQASLLERHDAGHRNGRVNEHSAAPSGGR